MANSPVYTADPRRRNWLFAAVALVAGKAWSLRWLFGIPMATLLFLAALFAVRQPDVYSSTAVLRVVEHVGGGRSDLPEERDAEAKHIVATAYDRLMTGQNLEALALELGLESADPAVLGKLAEGFTIEKRTDRSFSVTATHRYPARAQKMVEGLLAAAVTNEEDRIRDEAQERTTFRETDLSRFDSQVREAKDALAAFDDTYRGRLPDDRTRIEQKLMIDEAQLEELKGDVAALWDQLRARNAVPAETALPRTGRSGTGIAGRPSPRELALEKERAALEAKLRELRRQREIQVELTGEKNPLVERFDAEIEGCSCDLEELEAELAELRGASAAEAGDAADAPADGAGTGAEDPAAGAPEPPAPAGAGDDTAPDPAEPGTPEADPDGDTDPSDGATEADPDAAWLASLPPPPTDPELLPTYNQWKRGGLHIRELERAIREGRTALGEIPFVETRREQLVDALEEATRVRDALEREYTRASLRDRWEKMHAARQIPFVVEHGAQLPTSPSGPNRGRMLLMGLGLGAGLGYGLFLLRKRFHHAPVSRVEDISDLVQSALVVSVPLLGSGLESRATRRVPWSEILLGAWVVFAVLASVYLVQARAQPMGMPPWLADLLRIPSA